MSYVTFIGLGNLNYCQIGFDEEESIDEIFLRMQDTCEWLRRSGAEDISLWEEERKIHFWHSDRAFYQRLYELSPANPDPNFDVPYPIDGNKYTGDIWEFNERGDAIVIPTNRTINPKTGQAIMGAGVAKQCRDRVPEAQKLWTGHIKLNRLKIGEIGNWGDAIVFGFSTKQRPQDESSIKLIYQSAIDLDRAITALELTRVAIPKVGCGLGRLDWEKTVKPLLLDTFSPKNLARIYFLI